MRQYWFQQKWEVRLIAWVAFAAHAGSSCVNTEQKSGHLSQESGIRLVDNKSVSANGKFVCDPFTDDPNPPRAGQIYGLAGKVRYLSADQPRYGTLGDFDTYGHVAPISLFLSDLNVPSRAYDRPFMTREGILVTDSDGIPFQEYFAFDLEAQVRLMPEDGEGLYQFAVIADDGAVLQLDRGTGFEPIVSNDGFHGARMVCGTEAVSMGRKSSIPMKFGYFQGPRYYVALVVLWREWDGVSSEVECGSSGNSYFWDLWVTPSIAKAPFNALLSRGWKVLKPENYLLPIQGETNPCVMMAPVATNVTGYFPAPVVNNPSVTFTFESNYPDALFECSLDGAAAVPCVSPVSYAGLSDGRHAFSVNGSARGLRDKVSASHHWRIDRVAQFLTFLSTKTLHDSIRIDWAISEPSTAALAWGDTTTMQSHVAESADHLIRRTMVLRGLAAGKRYYFQVSGHDDAGNRFDSSPYSTATLIAPVAD